MRKAIVNFVIIILALVSASIFLNLKIAYALPPASIYVSPSSTAVSVGSGFAISINVADVVNLYGYDVNVTFDKTILSCTSASVGSLFPTYLTFMSTINNTAGFIRYAITLRAPELPVNGSGDLLDVTFNSLSAGTSALTLSSVALDNSSALPIAYISTNASVTVSSPTSPYVPVGPSGSITVQATETNVSLASGTSTNASMGLSWNLVSTITVSNMVFSGQGASWIQASVPAVLTLGSNSVSLRITVPSGTADGEYTVTATLTVSSTYGIQTVSGTVIIKVGSSSFPVQAWEWILSHVLIDIFAGLVLALIVAVGLYLKFRK